MCDPATSPEALAVRESLIFTRWTIVDLEPASLERVASYLAALMEREPLKSGTGWTNERIVLGCLVTDLRTMVMAAGEPVGVQRDLRDARTKADERSARARAELAERAYHDLVSEAIETDHAERATPRNTAQHALEDDRDPRATDDQLTAASVPVPVTPAAEPAPDVESVSWV